MRRADTYTHTRTSTRAHAIPKMCRIKVQIQLNFPLSNARVQSTQLEEQYTYFLRLSEVLISCSSFLFTAPLFPSHIPPVSYYTLLLGIREISGSLHSSAPSYAGSVFRVLPRYIRRILGQFHKLGWDSFRNYTVWASDTAVKTAMNKIFLFTSFRISLVL
jgi:hypothetical protein